MKKMLAGVMALILTGSLLSSPGTVEAAVPFPTLNFDNGAVPAYVTGSNATLQVVTNTTGSKALRINYAAGDFPSVQFSPSTPWSVGSGNAIAFELTNPTDKDITFYLRVDDSAQADGVKDSIVTQAVAKAKSTKNYFLSLSPNVLDLGMRFLPPNPAGAQMGYAWGDKTINSSNIVSMQLFQLYPSASSALVLDNLKVIKDPNTDSSYLNGIADKYGQYTAVNWSDKVTKDQDLLDDKAQEAAALNGAPPAVLSQYGGWKNGPKLQATGHFRVTQHAGKWTLVDPEGYLFFSTGLDVVRLDDMHTWISGRDGMFKDLPAKNSSLGKHFRYTTSVGSPPLGQTEGWLFNHYSANLERKYGNDYVNQWKNVSVARFKNWGFNSLGNWSEPSLYFGKGSQHKMAYVANGWTNVGTHATIPSGEWGTVADPYDPQFTTSVKNMVQNQILAYGVAQDPWVIGVYIDNEIPWGSPATTDSKYLLISNILAMNASDAKSHAKRAMIAHLQTKYNNNIGALNTKWGTSFASFTAMNAPFKPAQISNGMVPDYSAMLKLLARKYFSIVDAELTQKLPNKLYLGARFAEWGISKEVQEAAAEYVDVVSYNVYKESVNGHSWMDISSLNKPAIVGEFAFGANDRGIFGTGPNSESAASSQQNRAEKFTNYVNAALKNPYFVGTHWFQYVDEPLLGRHWDGENYNLGFVDVADVPYAAMVNAAKNVHAKAYATRFGGSL
ncbi:hypothetical protein JJQ72_00150 [Paenibacillus sp. F411]|uniref:hypothetical protein n=1 Tax=Paenibacillus sp. F411 TaxID=2820239 RepID=UPI001AAFB1FA|nr:hypothetical protein [Paenibacillus sp. F411]MBO2942399.1 hypothetical protein [Paenibacillus sp. F411]